MPNTAANSSPAPEPEIVVLLQDLAQHSDCTQSQARRLRAHADHLTSLSKAIDGCGKVEYPNYVSAITCNGGKNWLCESCAKARDAALRALLGRTT